MPHVFETAPSGRARCRGCGQSISKGDLRFGERLPNPFREGEMTLWFHPLCAAYKRPQPILDTLISATEPVPDRDHLESVARMGLAHRRLPRVNGAERASSGRARCRSCREVIAKDEWRISLVYYEEGMFDASGFIHARCAGQYFETIDVLDRVRHFSTLSADEISEIAVEIAGGPAHPDRTG